MATDLNRDFTKDAQMKKRTWKRHSTSLAIREKNIIKTTMRYNTPIQFSQFSSVAQSCPTLCARQASLSITNSRSSHKLKSIESVMPSSHLILSSPSPPAPNPFQHQSLFQ